MPKLKITASVFLFIALPLCFSLIFICLPNLHSLVRSQLEALSGARIIEELGKFVHCDFSQLEGIESSTYFTLEEQFQCHPPRHHKASSFPCSRDLVHRVGGVGTGMGNGAGGVAGQGGRLQRDKAPAGRAWQAPLPKIDPGRWKEVSVISARIAEIVSTVSATIAHR